MYEAFYGLSEPPFRLTPDPHYLYLSTHHREALGHLLFGIREGTGFIAVTGDIGTGKTTLLRALLRDLEANTIVGYIFNPALSDLELLQTVNSEFSLPATSTSKKELVDELNRFLVAQKLAGKRVVVIVDEAQNLPPATLEQLRLLSNLETETTKLLQIVLVGQPELKQLLGAPGARPVEPAHHRALAPRAARSRRDGALHRAPPAHRRRARHGATSSRPAHSACSIGTRAACRGSINIAAHRALLAGYTREQRTISPALTRHVISELRTDDAGPSARRYAWLRVAGAGGRGPRRRPAGGVGRACAPRPRPIRVPVRARPAAPRPTPIERGAGGRGAAAVGDSRAGRGALDHRRRATVAGRDPVPVPTAEATAPHLPRLRPARPPKPRTHRRTRSGERRLPAAVGHRRTAAFWAALAERRPPRRRRRGDGEPARGMERRAAATGRDAERRGSISRRSRAAAGSATCRPAARLSRSRC